MAIAGIICGAIGGLIGVLAICEHVRPDSAGSCLLRISFSSASGYRM